MSKKEVDEMTFWSFGLFAIYITVFLLWGLPAGGMNGLWYIVVILPIVIMSWMVTGIATYQLWLEEVKK